MIKKISVKSLLKVVLMFFRKMEMQKKLEVNQKITKAQRKTISREQEWQKIEIYELLMNLTTIVTIHTSSWLTKTTIAILQERVARTNPVAKTQGLTKIRKTFNKLKPSMRVNYFINLQRDFQQSHRKKLWENLIVQSKESIKLREIKGIQESKWDWSKSNWQASISVSTEMVLYQSR